MKGCDNRHRAPPPRLPERPDHWSGPSKARPMTDHPIRFFADNDAVRRIGEGLLARALPKEEWTHEAHLAACLWLLVERPDIDPARDLRDIISSYNESVGGVNDATQGYHHTITLTYLAGVRGFLARTDSALSLVEKVNRLLAAPEGRRDWPLSRYTPERLSSVEARLAFIPPDRPSSTASTGLP